MAERGSLLAQGMAAYRPVFRDTLKPRDIHPAVSYNDRMASAWPVLQRLMDGFVVGQLLTT